MFCYNNVLMFSPMGGKERTSVYLVGWENAWDWMPFWKDWGPTYQEGWCGFFNIPREAVLTENNTFKMSLLHILRFRRPPSCVFLVWAGHL